MNGIEGQGWQGAASDRRPLLSCSTGAVVDGGYCFAEELANALGVTVWAPNDLIIFRGDGTFYIGRDRGGEFLPFGPNERGRIK